ncbi:MAG: response regulator [Gammaproteobacteria bacterium]|nr:response regulator [Gammaproteobacteria bacterium]MDH5512478.1 response regulator [Gammaproteobacteria bacterium]
MKPLPRVLVVDDDPVIGQSFDRVLSGKGYAVITAANGEEALRKLKDEDYDVVFADIKMPGMSGLEVAEQIKASQPWLPVVIVTGYGTEANEKRAGAAGVSGFLRKPLTPDMIEDSAHKALLEKGAAAELAVKTAASEIKPEPKSITQYAKNVGLFVASPFIGLAYVIALPFVGLGMLAWFGIKALHKAAVITKNVGLFIVVPFIGLVYVIALPIVGVGLLAWFGAKAMI